MLGEAGRHPPELVLQPVAVGDVALEGLFVADRDAFRARLERSRVDAACAVAEQRPDLARQQSAELGVCQRRERADRLQADLP